MSFIDLGEIIMEPVIGTNEELVIENNIITEERIWDGINNAKDFLNEKNLNYVNMIARNEMVTQVMPDLLKLYSEVPMSISFMKDYKIINITGNFNPYAATVILHDGIEFDKDQMNLRIFSTIKYMKTIPIFISLFKCKDSDFNILDIEAKDYYGYGKIGSTKINDPWNIKYFTN